MNSWAVVCACSLSVECLYYVLCHSFLLPFSSCWFCSCSVSCGGCCCCCCCSSSHVQIANLCFASALCCVLSWMFVSSCSHTTCLSPLPKWLWYQHWLAFALPHHVPPTPSTSFPHPLQSWLAVAVTTSLLSCVPPSCTSCLLGLWHPALPMSYTIWWLPSHALSVVDCAVGNGVVHQNLGFLLTGTTTVKSVSTRSRERPFLWVTTPPSHRREYWLIKCDFWT